MVAGIRLIKQTKKNFVFQEGMGQSGMEKVRPQISYAKQVKDPCLDVKEVEILSESDVLENIQKGIMIGFGTKAVEHKE